MEAVNASELDLGALLPDLSTFLGWIELVLRVAVMAGPLLLLGFGLVYLLAPPKEANFGLGYRCWWGMASLESWKYTQRIAGMIWSGLGAVLTIVMALLCSGFRDMAPMDMAWQAGIYLLCELVLLAVSCVAINVLVILRFDKDGYLRDEAEE